MSHGKASRLISICAVWDARKKQLEAEAEGNPSDSTESSSICPQFDCTAFVMEFAGRYSLPPEGTTELLSTFQSWERNRQCQQDKRDGEMRQLQHQIEQEQNDHLLSFAELKQNFSRLQAQNMDLARAMQKAQQDASQLKQLLHQEKFQAAKQCVVANPAIAAAALPHTHSNCWPQHSSPRKSLQQSSQRKSRRWKHGNQQCALDDVIADSKLLAATQEGADTKKKSWLPELVSDSNLNSSPNLNLYPNPNLNSKPKPTSNPYGHLNLDLSLTVSASRRERREHCQEVVLHNASRQKRTAFKRETFFAGSTLAALPEE
eukprot:g47798.t1